MADGIPLTSSSPFSPAQHPGWAAPRSPLPPVKLAKLANALGIPTPIPAHPPSPNAANSPTYSMSSSPYSDHLRRSPTPSTTLNVGYSQPTSKFLLHVIPPEHLLHGPEFSDSVDLAPPPPPNASGYHVQFRRGILVPMHATLQSQLGAIAKEYALPSTAGMILYLVQSLGNSRSPNMSVHVDDVDFEPGPRLSEDIWKIIWARVIQTEREEIARSPTPNVSNSGIGLGVPFSAYSPHEFTGGAIRPPLSTLPLEILQPMAYPFSPSPSTPSSASDIRSHSKSAPPSSSSISQSEPATPDTSSADKLELPGLHSPSLVPILAKVEFDIDRQRAGWYEPWLRSRRMNHAKRAESQSSRSARSREKTEGSETVDERKAPLDLVLIGRMGTASPSPSFAISVSEMDVEPQPEGYGLLSESPENIDFETADSDKDESDEELTTRVAATAAEDPLKEIFGTDADTWARLHEQSPHRHSKDPQRVDFALNAADFADESLEDDYDREVLGQKEEDEVIDLLEAMSQPRFSVTVSSSPPLNNQPLSQTNVVATKKHIPPPLVLPLREAIRPTLLSPSRTNSEESTNLPYLDDKHTYRGDDSMFSMSDGAEDEYVGFRSHADEKRDGGVFDGLDLGLEEFGYFDEDDPNDRRKSQYLMKARLDEIEKTLAQFSPQRLKTDDEVEEDLSTEQSPSPSRIHQQIGFRNADVLPATPTSSSTDMGFQRDSHSTSPQQPTSATWPTVPFSTLVAEASRSRSAGPSDSPPRLAVNGVSTAVPTFHSQPLRSPTSPGTQTETEIRKRALEEHEALHSALPSLGSPSLNSPIIPMSPDPFGRYPSTIGINSSKQSDSYWHPNEPAHNFSTATSTEAPPPRRPSKEISAYDQLHQSDATSSRFSADSITGTTDKTSSKPNNRATLINVKSFKNLWRKSNKSSASGPSSAPIAGRSSPPLGPPHSSPLPTHGVLEPLAVSRSSTERSLPTPVLMQHRADSSVDRLHFNQESRYPVRRSPALPSQPPTPTFPPVLPEKDERERSARKSILKSWKSTSVSLSPNPSPNFEPRSSMERPIPQVASKSRRPSVMTSASGRRSLTSPEVPPSPQIPQHFINTRPNDHRQSSRTKLTTASSSFDSLHQRSPPTHQPALTGISPPRSHSVASSRASGESKHSFDASDFEMVSPKINSFLGYPYHALDHSVSR